MKNFSFYSFKFYSIISLLVLSCGPDPGPPLGDNRASAYSNEVAQKWNELFILIDKDAVGFRPAPSANYYAYISYAAYETVVPGMPSFRSLQSLFPNELTLPKSDPKKFIHWPTALNSCYYYMYKNLFANTQYRSLGGQVSNSKVQLMIEENNNFFKQKFAQEIEVSDFDNSEFWGESVAKAVFAWAKRDPIAFEANLNPSNNDPTKPGYIDWSKYNINNAIPGRWQLTNDNIDGGYFIIWGHSRTFTISEAQKLTPPPKAYNNAQNSDYYAQQLEVYNSTHVSAPFDRKEMGQLWNGDIVTEQNSPTGSIVFLLNNLFILEKTNLEKSIEAMAKIGFVLNDATVSAFHSKWTYKIESPENFIKREIDPKWEPLLNDRFSSIVGITPSYPSYPSAHSMLWSGCAVILTDLFGANYNISINRIIKNAPPFTRAIEFPSFFDVGHEASISQLYLGINARYELEVGENAGRKISKSVLALPWKK